MPLYFHGLRGTLGSLVLSKMVACKYSGSCSLPLRDLSLLAARERMMREAGALLAGAAGAAGGDAAGAAGGGPAGGDAARARVAGWGADAAADASRLRGAEEAMLAAVGSGAWDIDRTGELDAFEGTLLDALEGTPMGTRALCEGDAAAKWMRAPPDASPRAREAFAAAQRQRNECVSGAFARARPRAFGGLDAAGREVLKLLRVSCVVAIQNIVDRMPEMQTCAMMHAMLLWCEYAEACGAALAQARRGGW